MSLQTGPNSIRNNVSTLMKPVISPARKKAIQTIAKKHGMSFADAQFHQAKRIAQVNAKKS